MPRSRFAFVALNTIGIALLAVIPLPALGVAADAGLERSILTRWMPLALAIATALALVLARGVNGQLLLRRHAGLWLAPLTTYALVAFGRGVGDPVVGVPFVALVAAIALNGLEWLWRTQLERSDRELAMLLGLVLLAAALALLPYDRARQRAEADEPHYLIEMRSLVVDHDFDLRNQYDEKQYRDFYTGADLADRIVVDVGSHQFPIRDPGLPLLGAVPFALAGRDGVLMLMCAIVAAFTWRLFAFLRAVGVPRRAAFLGTSLAFVHPIFTYTTQIYPDVVALLCILVAAEALLAPTVGRVAVASALAGALPVLSVRLWPAAIGIGLVLLWLAARRRSSRWFAAALAPGALLVLSYAALDLALFGVPIPNAGYFAIRDQQVVLSFTPWIGLPGLALDRAYGLLSRSPIYLVAFAGAVPLARRIRAVRSPGLVALFLAWLLYVAYIADVQYWYADFAPSSRYMLATISFVVLAAAEGFAVLSRLARMAAWITAGWSTLVTFGFALDPPLRHDAAAEMAGTNGDGKLWTAINAVFGFDPGAIFPSLFRHATADWLIAVLWAPFLIALVVGAARNTMSRRADATDIAPHTRR